MKKKLVVLSLSLALASPVALTQIAMAQVTPTAVVAQRDSEAELNAYATSEYSYQDALVLGSFWGMDLYESKALIGGKILAGPESKAYLRMVLTDARTKALANVDDLKLYFNSGFNYNDAEEVAKFWGDSSPWEGKLRIERNLILGQADAVRELLRRRRR